MCFCSANRMVALFGRRSHHSLGRRTLTWLLANTAGMVMHLCALGLHSGEAEPPAPVRDDVPEDEAEDSNLQLGRGDVTAEIFAPQQLHFATSNRVQRRF